MNKNDDIDENKDDDIDKKIILMKIKMIVIKIKTMILIKNNKNYKWISIARQ